eukprot:TRINITY_DN10301_c0_g1_i1.p1 TRINITY_DN10301_c0_g1~~TRINITY_DN10301_c0_g1_i1.p1  ORF type:complete len:259 (-),score=41.85 TRINITY_DN10301_c0_g1_i1:40-816(-)
MEERPFEVTDTDVDLFRRYLGREDITKEDIVKRATEARAKALQVCNYRCIREGRFLESRLSTHPEYKTEVKPKISKTTKIIDLGCCFGTDIRYLVAEGAEPSLITGTDQFPEYIQLGFDLFGDKDKLTTKFVFEDFFSDQFTQKVLPNATDDSTKYDIAYAGSVYHLFSLEQTEKFTQLVNSLLKSGGIFFGQTVGSEQPTWASKEDRKDILRYLHSPESFKSLVEEHGFENVQVRWRQGKEPQGEKWGLFRFYMTKK